MLEGTACDFNAPNGGLSAAITLVHSKPFRRQGEWLAGRQAKIVSNMV